MHCGSAMGCGGAGVAVGNIHKSAAIAKRRQDGDFRPLSLRAVITVAHLTAVDANMGVRIASVALAAKVLKQGSEDVDLSLLSIDEEKLPASIKLPAMQLCEAPPWPGDPVIVVDAGRITWSRIRCLRSKSQMPARNYEPEDSGSNDGR